MAGHYLDLGKKTLTQDVAGGVVKTSKALGKIPSRFGDAQQAIKTLEDKIYSLKGGPLSGVESVYREFRLASGNARALQQSKIANFDSVLKPYQSVRDDAMKYMTLQDAVDRAGNGQLMRTINGKSEKVSVELAQEELMRAKAVLVAKGTDKKVDEVRQIFNNLNKEELEAGVVEGIYSRKGVDAILEAHPNYIPHNVILDEQERHLAGTLNVASSDLKKAVGSVRKIEDPFEAYKARLGIRSNLIVHNRNNRNLVDSATNYNIDGFRAIRTADQVEARQSFIDKLSELNKQKTALTSLYKKGNKQDKVLLSKINAVSDEVDKMNGEVQGWMNTTEASFFDATPTLNKPGDVGENYMTGGYRDEFKITDKDEVTALVNQLNSSRGKLTALEEKKYAGEVGLDELISSIGQTNTDLKQNWSALQATRTVKPKSGEETISLFRRGIREDWVVPSDIAEVIKKTDSVQALNVIGNVAAGANNIWKAMTTTYNPVFQIGNKIRDVQTARMVSGSLIQEMRARYGTTDELMNITGKESDKLFNDLHLFGSNVMNEGKTQFLGAMEKHGLAKVLDNTKNVVDQVANYLESSTRKEVFKEALRSGLDAKSAAFVARDATIDFEKAGSWVRDLNKVFPFLNARVQGATNVAKTVARNPEMFMREMAITSLYPALVLDRWNSQFTSSKDIDQQTKQRNWVIQFGEQSYTDEEGIEKVAPQFIAIPKGEGQQAISAPIQYYLAKLRGQDPRTADKMILDTLGNLSPINGDIAGSGKNPLLSLASMNPGTSWVAGVLSNKNPYFQTPIISPYVNNNADLYQYSKANKNTPEVLKEAAKILFDKGVDISPAMMEFTIKSLGGLPTDILKGAEAVNSASKGKDSSLTGTLVSKLSQLPVVRGFIKESNPDYSPANKAQQESDRKIEQDIATKQFERRNILQDYSNSINERYHESGENLQDPTFQSYLASVKSLTTPEEFKGLVTKLFDYSKGINGRVGNIKVGDPVAVRAYKIADKIKTMSAEERKTFLIELKKQKILTEDVVKELIRIQKAGQ